MAADHSLSPCGGTGATEPILTSSVGARSEQSADRQGMARRRGEVQGRAPPGLPEAGNVSRLCVHGRPKL